MTTHHAATRVRLVATATFATYFFGLGAAIPFLTIYYRGRGLDVSSIGLVLAVTAAIPIVGAPLWGAVADQPGRSRAMFALAALLAASGAVLLSMATNLVTIAGSVAVMAIGTSGVVPLLDARVLDTLGDDRDAYGRLRGWGSAAFVTGAALIGVIIERTSVAALFFVYVPALVVTAIVSWRIPGSRHHSPGIFAGASTVLADPRIRRFLVAAPLTWMLFSASNAYLALHLSAVGAPAWVIGAAWAVGALLELPVMYLFPSLVARIGIERVLVLGALMFPIRAAGFALTNEPYVILAITSLSGVGFGLFLVGGVTYVASLAPRGRGATAQGLLGAVSIGIAAVLGAGIGGVIANAVTIRGLFVVCSVGGFIAAAVVGVAVGARVRRTPLLASAGADEAAALEAERA